MRTLKKYVILWLPPLLLIVGFLCRELLVPIAQWAADHIFFCMFYEGTGLYCLGCGGTRSMMALLHGDIGRAFHNNPAAPLLLVVVLLLYIEKCAAVLGKPIKILPRKLPFWMVLLVLQIIWNIVRNLVPSMFPI